jgi:hypothetical protein
MCQHIIDTVHDHRLIKMSMWQIVAPLRGAMGSGSLTVKHTTSSMRQYVAPPSGDNLWITRPPSGGYILCQCGITSHRLRRATISCASVRGSHTISCVNATKCRTALRAVLYLVVLHLVASLRSAYYM